MRIFIVTGLVLIVSLAFAQPVPTPSAEAVQLKKVILEHHLESRLIDNAFAANVLTILLDESDPEQLYFTQNEIERLQAAHDKIDNDLNLNSWVFFPVFADTFEKALQRARSIVQAEMLKPLNLNEKHKDSADTSWAENEEALKRKWNQYLKDEVLYDMWIARKTKADVVLKDFLARQEPLSRKKIESTQLRAIDKIFQHTSGFTSYALTLYYNAISRTFDPHTSYFSPTQMENFVSELSTQGFYFGFGIRENDAGEIEISNLLPGSPAWKSGEMSSGDVLEKIRWEGKEWMELVAVSEEEVDAKLAESNQSVMEFVLRKPAGVQKTVKLKKEKLNTEESLVRGFILEGKRKIGYISLPDFYSSWGDDSGARCASDVAAEIIKLKKQQIEGLVLDVRYNGGGSLAEAVSMAGIFIDAGPVGIERIKGKEPFTIKDFNRGTIYDGPLVILVNGISASASEFLAAALQDYGRAIIVGSNTYGKATAQEMFSLRPGKEIIDFSNLTSDKWGFVKVTSGKTYRINGKSIQKIGVIPDVALPDIADSFEYRESEEPFALSPDYLNKKTYWQPVATLPIAELREKSEVRVAPHKGFEAIRNYVDFVKEKAKYTEGMDWTGMTEEMTRQEKVFAELREAYAIETGSFKVNLHDFGKERMQMDEYVSDVNNAWIKNLSHDISLEEAFNIICDYIDVLNKK